MGHALYLYVSDNMARMEPTNDLKLITTCRQWENSAKRWPLMVTPTLVPKEVWCQNGVVPAGSEAWTRWEGKSTSPSNFWSSTASIIRRMFGTEGYALHCARFTPHTVRCALCIAHPTVHSLQILHCAVTSNSVCCGTLGGTLHHALCTLHAHCALCTLHWYSAH